MLFLFSNFNYIIITSGSLPCMLYGKYLYMCTLQEFLLTVTQSLT